MKTLKTLVAAGLAIAYPNMATARKAEIQSFTDAPSAFQIFEPGFDPVEHRGPEPVDATYEALDLSHEFAILAANSTTVARAGGHQGLSIPARMRLGARTLMPSVNLPLYTSISLENCGTVPYLPHPTLNASQELRRQRYFPQMAAAACGAGVPVDLFDALIIQESRYNPLALSAKGASGLTQLMPATAHSVGVFDRWSITQNLLGGARYLRKQLDRFGNWALALGAYNAGPGNVTRYGGLPPFKETRGYVRNILSSVKSHQLSRRSVGGPVLGSRREVVLASFNP